MLSVDRCISSAEIPHTTVDKQAKVMTLFFYKILSLQDKDGNNCIQNDIITIHMYRTVCCVTLK